MNYKEKIIYKNLIMKNKKKKFWIIKNKYKYFFIKKIIKKEIRKRSKIWNIVILIRKWKIKCRIKEFKW